MRTALSKIRNREEIHADRDRLRAMGRKVVFTNGCFDILHVGHIDYLTFAREQGDALIVGINSDASVKKNKGQSRPILPQDERAKLLASLEVVDFVVIFNEDEPLTLIGEILPDILVKGEDWSHYVSGREIVEKNGGKVVLAKLTPGRSTTDMIGKILAMGSRASESKDASNKSGKGGPAAVREAPERKTPAKARGATFIVTGAAGFIGSNIVRELNESGCDDIIVVDRKDDTNRINLEGLKFREYMDKEDFRNAWLKDKLTPAETVIHMGACSSTTETNQAYLTDNNFEYTKSLCLWSLNRGVRFIYASSAATYGDGSHGYSDDDDTTQDLKPLNLYGESKQMFDKWALQNRLFGRIAGLKYFNVYGPGENHKGDMRSVVNKAYRQIVETGELKLFKSYRSEYRDGEQDRDFIYIRDAVNVTLYFHEHPEISGLFNCGTGRARTWIDLARAVFEAMDRKPQIRFIDMPEAIRDKYQYHTQADMSKLRLAGYAERFTSIENGVLDYVKNYLAKAK